ncbi:hypothetical protein E2C01_006879 [Portunus trituberculatus]|uniref:Uncharacterized protein n=1 Tax=Portunus trituberculatus TaxID=210409 RepID=A0A5B7D0W1_PORTR|nr:hypothetical protein [Portunus trituberculatus]
MEIRRQDTMSPARNLYNTTSIQSLLSRIDDGEFIDDGDYDSDDPRDDSDEDRDCVFGEDYSESEESSDDEHEGPAAPTLPPPRTRCAATSSPLSP